MTTKQDNSTFIRHAHECDWGYCNNPPRYLAVTTFTEGTEVRPMCGEHIKIFFANSRLPADAIIDL